MYNMHCDISTIPTFGSVQQSRVQTAQTGSASKQLRERLLGHEVQRRLRVASCWIQTRLLQPDSTDLRHLGSDSCVHRASV